MDWKDVGKIVANAAPALGGLLGGPLGATIGSVVAGVFGTAPEPSEVAQAIQRDPAAAVKLAEIQAEVEKHRATLAVQAQQAALAQQVQLAAEGSRRLAEVNATMRAELTAATSGVGVFRTGWRPAFGWIMAASFGAVMFAVAFLLVTAPEQVGVAANGIASLTTIWSVGLSVLGVAVWKRSDDKRVTADPEAITVLGAVAQRIAGR